MAPAGVGIVTDSTHITLTDITTTGNQWGSVALHDRHLFHAGHGRHRGTLFHDEPIGIFSQDERDRRSRHRDLPPSFTGDGDGTFVVTNDSHRLPSGDSDTFTYFFGSGRTPPTSRSRCRIRNGRSSRRRRIVVTDGMSIQAAICREARRSSSRPAPMPSSSHHQGHHHRGRGRAVLEGTLLSHLGVPDGTHLSDFMEANHPSYSAGGTGVTIGADDVSIRPDDQGLHHRRPDRRPMACR